MRQKLTRVFLCLLFLGIGAWTLVGLAHYPGNGYVYLLFSVLFNALLFFGLRRGSLFFDTFLGVFFWLGFWLKFSVRIIFADGRFYEYVGYFDYSREAYDRALLVCSCGAGGLLVARLIRERFLFDSHGSLKPADLSALRSIYAQNRSLFWLGFSVVVLGVTITNAYFGIYQRGSIPRTVLPFGLSGVYTWLLLFGVSSISAVLLHFDLQLRARVSYLLILLVFIETFMSNVSMLSRGMILNAGALLFGTYIAVQTCGISLRWRTVAVTLVTVIVLFVSSIFVVNQLRLGFFREQPAKGWSLKELEVSKERVRTVGPKMSLLFMDRWIGMEGAMAVSSYPGLGWDLWKEVWSEKYTGRGTSLYDRKIAMSNYSRDDLTNHHFISMSGALAFFYYPGSFWFLFISMFALGVLGAAIEAAVYKYGGGNLILCSLIAFVVAYRYVHFGYVPARSYLLAAAIALNVILIYLSGKIVANWSDSRNVGVGGETKEHGVNEG